jgi:glycosyltransferase involved in cell wall biosynthesis
MAPRFSVLMPTHNRADVLDFAIRSVLWQSASDFELLIVGDGCTDNTAEIVAQHKDPRIRWFDLPKAPYFGYANRNVALREARGEYVAFAAHDDLLLPDHLATLASEAERTQAEWLYSRPVWVSSDGVVVPFMVNLHNNDELNIFLTQYNSLPASCVLHRRDCLDKYGYWPEHFPVAADWRLWIRMIEGGRRKKFAYCAVPSTLHFRAVWRSDRAIGSTLMAAALVLAEKDWWPPDLKLKIPDGVPEQAVFFKEIAERDYANRLRRATSNYVDRLALDYLSMSNSRPRRILKRLVRELRSRLRL